MVPEQTPDEKAAQFFTSIFEMLQNGPSVPQNRLNASFGTMDELVASLKRHGWERVVRLPDGRLASRP